MVFFGLGKRPAMIIRFSNGDSFDVDCTLLIDPQRTANITQHPTSKGVTISDHRDKNPRVVNLQGIMSDVHPGRGPSFFNPIPDTDYHKRFRSRMEEADDNDEPITVDCGERGIWENYYLSNLNMPTEPSQGKAVKFNFTINEIKVVETGTENLLRNRLNNVLSAVTGSSDTIGDILNTTPVKDAATVQRWSGVVDRGLAGTAEATPGMTSYMDDILSKPGF